MSRKVSGFLRVACRAAPVALAVAVTSGCSHIQWSRVGVAAERAAKDPLTWGSAGAAALFALDGNSLDTRLSDWAKTNNPVFGSQQQALEASDQLRRAADTGAKVTALMVPTQHSGGEWLWDKSKTLVLESVSASLTLNTTGVLKQASDRERPNQSPTHDSFPSAHSSTAFNDASLGSLHVQQFNLPKGGRNLLSAGFFSLAGGTAWARVEGGVHYPSDVLFGAAVGNFFAIFIHDAFIRPGHAGPPPLTAAVGAEGILLRYQSGF